MVDERLPVTSKNTECLLWVEAGVIASQSLGLRRQDLTASYSSSVGSLSKAGA